MALDARQAMNLVRQWPPVPIDLKAQGLYALSLGYGNDPLDDRALDFLLASRGPKVVPTLATCLAPSLSRELGLTMHRVLHAEQRLEMFGSFPVSGTLAMEATVDSVEDKGEGKGAFVTFSNLARLAETGEPIFRSTNVLFARGDGGCGSQGTPPPKLHPCPDRAPDLIEAISTNPNQALLFRLNGDFNPLHADPASARASGFKQPILHGLATYGFAARALIDALAIDPGQIRTFDVRFSAPVYPGETIETSIWRDDGWISFRSIARERGVVVLDFGRSTLQSTSV